MRVGIFLEAGDQSRSVACRKLREVLTKWQNSCRAASGGVTGGLGMRRRDSVWIPGLHCLYRFFMVSLFGVGDDRLQGAGRVTAAKEGGGG